MNLLKQIAEHWQILITLGGAFLIVYTTIKIKVPSIEKRLEKIEQMELVTKAHCAEMQSHCQQLICNKIDNIKIELAKMDRQRQAARGEFYSELKQINKFMGRVEQFISNNLG